MSTYVEFQDLKVRVNTDDAFVDSYTEKVILAIDPDGTASTLTGTVEDTTWIAGSIDPADLIHGWWRFAASALDNGGKVRKSPWYKLYIKAIGEV